MRLRYSWPDGGQPLVLGPTARSPRPRCLGPTPRALHRPAPHLATRLCFNFNFIFKCAVWVRAGAHSDDDTRLAFWFIVHRLQFGFRQENILMMTDDCPDPTRRPTKANMFQVGGVGGVA